MSLNGRKVKAASMHENSFVAGADGVGELRKELTIEGDAVNKAVLSMEVQEPFLIVKTKNKINKTVELAIPLTNFKHLVLIDEK